MLQDFEFEEDHDEASALTNKYSMLQLEDGLIEQYEAEEAEKKLLYKETRRRKELEELLLHHSVTIEEIKNHHARCVEELELIQEQNSMLKHELRKGKSSEEELECRIIQAVELLIAFRNKRDKLQAELDSTVKQIGKYKALSGVDLHGTMKSCFFGISSSDIIESTQNFSKSHKIGQGKYGTVYKGILRSVKVAIRMLPSSSFQSDSDFIFEAEILSRLRHPHIVTLIGACAESRSLAYEYIDNCSLEHYLSTPEKASSLGWQTRMRIATEICCALLFIHANASCDIHGNMKTSNILLDSNLVTKISDFGLYRMMSPSESFVNSQSPYMDPEFHSTGHLTTHSDVYAFGIILLQLLTARPSTTIVGDVKLAIERRNIETLLDLSAGNWPPEVTEQLLYLGLRCCDENRHDRPHLESEIWTVLDSFSKLYNTSTSSGISNNKRKAPSHFLCPIYQEVMKDPHIANDGFTYEGDAIKGWFNSGHMTSPMTNLKLKDCGLTPNYALYYAIQEWNNS